MAVASLMVSCQKEEGTQNTQKLITRTVTLEEGEWQEDATRTIYEPGAGVKFTGAEVMSIYYADHNAQTKKMFKIDPKKKQGKNITSSITINKDGTYTVVHPEISGATAYDYYFMLGGSQTNLNGTGTSAAVKLEKFQQPGENSFDPTYDFLAGCPILNVAKQTEAITVQKFKRISAPLKVVTATNADKVILATLSFTQKVDNKNALAGNAFLHLSDVYNDITVNSYGADNFSNTVTAFYPNATNVVNQTKNIWYTVYPASIKEGNVVMTLMTPTKTLTRMVPVTKALNIVQGQLNEIHFNMAGTDVTEVASVYQDFTQLQITDVNTGNPVGLVASDGQTYQWTFTKDCSIHDGKNTVYANSLGSLKGTRQIWPKALSMPATTSKITFPDFGKPISKIRIYVAPTDQDNLMKGTTGDKGIIEITDPTKFNDFSSDEITNSRPGRIVGIAFEFAPAA